MIFFALKSLLASILTLKSPKRRMSICQSQSFILEAVHKLFLNDVVCPLYVNVHAIGNVNEGGVGGQKRPKSCQRSFDKLKHEKKICYRGTRNILELMFLENFLHYIL